MELDLGQVLGGAASVPETQKRDLDEVERIVAVLTAMQEGINQMTEILLDHKGRIDELEMELRRVKARTDVPVRKSSLIRLDS